MPLPLQNIRDSINSLREISEKRAAQLDEKVSATSSKEEILKLIKINLLDKSYIKIGRDIVSKIDGGMAFREISDYVCSHVHFDDESEASKYQKFSAADLTAWEILYNTYFDDKR